MACSELRKATSRVAGDCTAALLLVLAASSVVWARGFYDSTANHGFRGELLLASAWKGLSFSETMTAEIQRGHARAKSLAAIIATGGSYEAPISSVPGGFAMNLTIGTPGQKFIAIADTGSDLVWVQSMPCTRCSKQLDAPFNPSKSSTFKKLPCTSSYCRDLPAQTCNGTKLCPYAYKYGDSSQTNGQLSTETITLTSSSGSKSTVANFVFGYGTNNTGFDLVDGIVGLGMGPLSLTSQLGTQFSNKFSYCLVPFDSQFSIPSPIYFGNAAVPSGAIKYTPFVSNPLHPSFYYVNLEAISVAGKKLNIPASTFAIDSAGKGGLLFDSGTTITYLAAAAYKPLENALKNAISYPQTPSSLPDVFTLCYTPNTMSPTFPNITFHFEGADVVLPSENTFINIGVQILGQTYCLGMSTSPFNVSIFGNVQQANFDILYDRTNFRLGFVSTQCGSTVSKVRGEQGLLSGFI